MKIPSLRDFLGVLDDEGLLKKISVEVDAEYEIAEIVNQLYVQSLKTGEDAPALLFEKVCGSSLPLAINVLGSAKSIRLLLEDEPENISGRLTAAALSFQRDAPRGGILSWAWEHKDLLLRARAARSILVEDAPAQEIKKTGNEVNLLEYPIMKCWPLDGGKFITAGLVITKSPKTGARNMGIYRLQAHGPKELGLHWQIQKGGGFHYAEAEALNRPLEVAVVIGSDPLLWFGGILPLPEGMDEVGFAGLLAGRPTPMVRCQTLDLEVPAGAEIVIEGIARPGRRLPEGPFGDHFGHYSHQAPFPVLEVQCITQRKDPIYFSAVVGKPPQEDKAMGEAVSKTFLPVLKMMKPELENLWAFYEAGFHNLLAAALRQRYEKEAMKTALSLLGEGQLSLSKCVVLTDPDVDVRSFPALLRAIRENFDPGKDFVLLPGTAQDTLDFTGPRLNMGSKMILDATSQGGKSVVAAPAGTPDLKNLDANILGCRNWEGALLAVQVQGEGRPLLEKLLREPSLQAYKLIAVVSPDAPLDSDALLIWGIFTRFDCERDILFAESKLSGIRPVYRGPLGIDASWKSGYPKPVEPLPETAVKVGERWKEYGF